MSLAGVTSRMSNGTYQLTRQAPGSRDARGVWQPGATSTYPLTCAIFPGAGKELLPLPEGRRVEDVITIYSEVQLNPSASGPDRLTYSGESYVVTQVMTYAARGVTLYVALASREVTP